MKVSLNPNRSLEIFSCKKSDYSRRCHRYSICILTQYVSFVQFQDKIKAKFSVLLKFWYIYVSKFEETFICKREIDALPPIIRFAVFILLTEPSRIPLFNLLAIELLMAE